MKANSPLFPNAIIRSNRKTVSIRIDAQGRLIVRAPKGCGDERIFAFLQQKQNWIFTKQAQRRQTAIPPPGESLDGYQLLLLGKPTTLRVYDGTRVRYEDEQLFLPAQNPQKRLIAWLKANALRIFTASAQAFSKTMNVAYKSLSVGSARGRWGSCTRDNKLRFSFRLLFAPKAAVEYVVVHELAHILHKNHSKAFWQTVASYCPDYKTQRAWLKDHGGLMEIF